MSAKIEKAYKRDPTGSFEVGDKIKYKIDFKTMTETCLHPDYNQTMKIYRKLCEGISTPKHLVPKTITADRVCENLLGCGPRGILILRMKELD